MDSDLLTLTCWIRSLNPRNFVLIKIPKAHTIYDLQWAIKNEDPAAFRDVGARALILYKPNHPVLRPYEESLIKFTLSEHAVPLVPDSLLSEVFPEQPPSPSIHIIVDAPWEIDCWLRGEALGAKISIPFQPGEDTNRLIPRIKDAYPQLRNVPYPNIRLYHTSGNEDELQECLSKTEDGTPLKKPLLGLNFLGVPVLGRICVVVEFSTITRSTNPAPFAHSGGFGGADPIATARDTFIRNRAQKKKSPSDSAKPSEFRATQGNPATQIPCGRPRGPEEVIPVTLLHSVFGQFEDDCHTGTMTDDDNQFVGKLANAMSDIHASEEDRMKAVDEVFKEAHINLNLSKKVHGTRYEMDSSLSVDEDSDIPPFFIAEFKNEIGTTNSEPYMQVASYYLEATKRHALKKTKFPFPCFLLLALGPYMIFAGAVWNVRPVIQVLSTPLAFHYHSTDTRTQLTVARHMAAFRKALKTLKTCYAKYKQGFVAEHQSHDILFPYCTVFKSLEDESTQTIRYTEQLDEGGGKKTRLVFFGTLEGDQTSQICIKFTKRYSKEAHLQCAKLGFAPKLRGCEVLPGGWYMVVMDNLVQVGYDLLADLPDTEQLPRSAFDSIKIQLKELHSQQLVHGDIRESNIFINKDRTKLMLIDFDWGGVEDDVQYPPYVNFLDVRRPQDARDGLPIKTAHDIEMLRFITEARAIENS